jgi:hypothetical protein
VLKFPIEFLFARRIISEFSKGHEGIFAGGGALFVAF